MSDFSQATRAVRAGIDSDAAHGAVVPPIVLSTNFSFAGNLELQAIRAPAFAMILFGGLNMNVTNMSFKTPYNLYYATTGTTYTG